MPKEAKPPIVFTPEQLACIEQNWKMEPLELAKLVFNDPTITRRDHKFNCVRRQIANVNRKDTMGFSVSTLDSPGRQFASLEVVTGVDLTEDHKEYIRNNYANASGPWELAKVIFGDPNLAFASKQTRAVSSYLKTIDPNYKKNDELADDEDYEAPRGVKELVQRMTVYGMNLKDGNKPLFDINNLSPNDVKQLNTLLGYMGLPLFKIQATKYVRKIDRVLFESTFIWLCWNKTDLTSEEVHQYVAFAGETVKSNQIERTVQLLDERLNGMLSGAADSKLNMAEIELLNSVREKANASMKQQAALLKSLVGDRSKRLAEKIQSSASMHQLVEAMRREEDRKKVLRLAEKYRTGLKQEVERLSSMDALKAEIFGVSAENILI